MDRQRMARRFANLKQARDGWYRIVRNHDGSAPTRVDVYDEIGGHWLFGGVSAADFAAELAQIEGDIEVHINSPGGDVFDGIAIYNAIAQRPGNVTTVVDGLAASAASFIAQAGKTRIIAPGAMMMIHDAFGVCMGNAADMREMAGLLDQVSGNIADIYAAHTGKPVDGWRGAMQAETWYTAQEAVDAGLADKLAERPAEPDATARFDLSIFAKVPDWAARKPDEGDDQAVIDRWVRHIHNADVDESAWDGDAAMKAAGASDDPAAAFKAICAGRREGDADQRGSWALPHHKHPGDPANRAGVNNALSRLPQTQGLTNEAAARAHLEAHQKAMGGGADDASNHAGQMPAWIAALPDAGKEAAGR